MATTWPKVVQVSGKGEERFVIGLAPTRDPSVSWKGYAASAPMSEPLSEADVRRRLEEMGLTVEQMEAKIQEARKKG